MNLAVKQARAGTLRLGAPAAGASVLCVFLHGRGQTAELMADHVVARLGHGAAHLVLPRAPGGAWYDARAIDPLTDATRDQMEAALDRVDAAINAAATDGAPPDRLVLAGFSQGACLASEYALRRHRRLAALVLFTGCRVGYPVDDAATRDLSGLPVYASDGSGDSWIPLDAFFAMTQSLARAGATLRAEVFPGRAHEVSEAEIGVLDGILADVAAGRAPLHAAYGAAR